MLVGAAREIINPEIGHRLCGYGPDYPNTGVHDDITVTALYLHDSRREAFLLNCDLLGLLAVTEARIRGAVAQAAGVPAESVFLACTHVHSAPNALVGGRAPDDPDWECRAAYVDRLIAWSVQAAAAAKANAEPCDLLYNYAHVAENMNRRLAFPDRRFLYLPANKQLIGQSQEYVDRELGILAFRRPGGKNRYKAILTNYTCHPLCVGNTSNLVSADFQGALRRRVEETFAGCLCLTTTGAAGDNHPLLPEAGFAAAEAMGTRLAEQTIMRCYDAVPADYDTRLRLARAEVALPYKDDATRRRLPTTQARQPDPAARSGTRATHVSLLGIGPVLFAGFPGEPAAELGAMLKWSSPFLRTYALHTATDCLSYFPTCNQYYWGGHEPEGSPFACGAGEVLVQRILETARRLVSEQPLLLPAVDAAGTPE